MGYRCRLRLPGFAYVVSAEHYSILCGVKYVLRMRIPFPIIFIDSLLVLASARNRFSRSDQGLRVVFVWMLSHASILESENTDGIARSASRLPVVDRWGILRENLYSALRRDCCMGMFLLAVK